MRQNHQIIEYLVAIDNVNEGIFNHSVSQPGRWHCSKFKNVGQIAQVLRQGIMPIAQTQPSSTTYLSNGQDGPLQLLPVLDTSDMDPELARYLNRHYWDNRAVSVNAQQQPPSADQSSSYAERSTPQPSAPIYASPDPSVSKINAKSVTVADNLVRSGNENNIVFPIKTEMPALEIPGVPELTTPKQEEFLKALRASIEFFVNRMQSNSQRNRSIANDTTVQALFLTLHEMHPQLLQQKQAMEDRRSYFEHMQDKLTQLREAREALNALRQEHAARRQMEEQEAARLRQLQMMQKLEVMRQQKRDTMEFRRRVAMEQTMQYQQQYGVSNNPQTALDPVTGLPLPIHSYPPTMMNTGVGSALGPNQLHFAPPLYTPSGQEALNGSTSQYLQQQQQQYPPSVYAYGQQQPAQQIPPTYASTTPISSTAYPHPNYGGPYSMHQMESSLPPPMGNTGVYPAYIATGPVPGSYPTSNNPVQSDDPSQQQQQQQQALSPPDANNRTPSASLPVLHQQPKSPDQLISFD